MDFVNLKKEDKEIYDLMKKELKRQEKGIELIASENFVSRAVMEAMGSHLTNKYAEGYPRKRYYVDCWYLDLEATHETIFSQNRIFAACRVPPERNQSECPGF